VFTGLIRKERERRAWVCRPSASIASKPSRFERSDWVRGCRMWLLEWLCDDGMGTDTLEAK
jgi:hypothetical protein